MSSTPITEMRWRGERIVQMPYDASGNNLNGWGFKVTHAFQVLDDFDDHALPFVQQWFWTPGDAVAAIEARDLIAPLKISGKWPSTAQYEYNTMLVYRSCFYLVYESLQKIRLAIQNAKDFGDNPSADIEQILHLLHQNAFRAAKGAQP